MPTERNNCISAGPGLFIFLATHWHLVPTQSSSVGILDMADTAGDRAGSASHGGRSRDHIVVSTPNIAATANTADIADTVDTEHPNMDHSCRGFIPVPVDRGRPRQAEPEV